MAREGGVASLKGMWSPHATGLLQPRQPPTSGTQLFPLLSDEGVSCWEGSLRKVVREG